MTDQPFVGDAAREFEQLPATVQKQVLQARVRFDPAEPMAALLGKTLTAIKGCVKGSSEVIFECDDGTKFKMFHDQDCCETVVLEDVAGDPMMLIGQPLLLADVSSNDLNPPSSDTESHTWTFYRLGNVFAAVTLRWLGESNGYYSEAVSFAPIQDK